MLRRDRRRMCPGGGVNCTCMLAADEFGLLTPLTRPEKTRATYHAVLFSSGFYTVLMQSAFYCTSVSWPFVAEPMEAVGLGAHPPMASISVSSMVKHQAPEVAAALARHHWIMLLIPVCKDARYLSLGLLLADAGRDIRSSVGPVQFGEPKSFTFWRCSSCYTGKR